MAKDARVDEYIGKAADFAQPILQHLRATVHRALPDAVETIKWGMPHFTVNGKNVAGIAGFKAHCAFVIHGDGRQGDAMGQYGKITGLADLPSEADLIAGLQTARSRILEQGSATKKPVARKPKPEIPMPADFAAALAQVPEAQSVFEGFSPSARRDYLEWITEAKTGATRAKRMVQAIEWIALGKKRNWKYEKC
jgi:uncharacterized protein YdeI (YjbR/CyaY-like superfamily)